MDLHPVQLIRGNCRASRWWPVVGPRETDRQMKCVRWPISRVLYPRERGDGHSSGTFVTERLVRPTRATGPTDRPVRRTERALLYGLAPGGVYPAAIVTDGAVRSYRTLSPLPAKSGRFAFCGTFPGVAPAGCYPAPCLCGARTFLPCPGEPGQKRPPGHLTPPLGNPRLGFRQRQAFFTNSGNRHSKNIPRT